MEANVCDINHPDGDVLLPPRKRLLACLKKRNSNSNLHFSLAPSSSMEFSSLDNLLGSHLNNPDLSPDEIAEASQTAAATAVKVAEAARAAAEEKAAIAVKAIAAAKSALEVVASFSEEAVAKERYLKKNKLKKHVPVRLLYKKNQPIENFKKDEELARELHRDMNSSPRISRNSTSPNSKNHEHKKPKMLELVEEAILPNVVLGNHPNSTCNGHALAGELGVECSLQEISAVQFDKKTSKLEGMGQLEMDGRYAEAKNSEEKTSEALDDACISSRKRGRIRLKKLPLSLCTSRDQANPKEVKSKSPGLSEEASLANSSPLFSMESSADGVMMTVEAAPQWKCQAFKAAECIKQNKIMQS